MNIFFMQLAKSSNFRPAMNVTLFTSTGSFTVICCSKPPFPFYALPVCVSVCSMFVKVKGALSYKEHCIAAYTGE